MKLNDTEKSETMLKLKLKLYCLRCNTTSHNYQQKVNTQLDADSDFNTDFDNDYVQYNSLTSLINYQIHVIKNNAEYTDFNNS